MEYFLGFVFICLVLGAIGIYKRDKAKESEVVEEEPIKEDVINISEPIISFLKVFNENPRRFKLEQTLKGSENPEYGFQSGYKLTDNILKESWVIEVDPYYHRPRYSLKTAHIKIYSDGYFGWPEWMTREEREYVFLNLRSYYINRRNTLHALIKDRVKRSQDKERARLMKLYCKEDVNELV
jgi:hypothetical protein